MQLLAIARADLIRAGVLSDEAHYRDVMAGVCAGKRSARDLTPAERTALLNKLKSMGFKVKSSRRQPTPGAPAAADRPRRVRTLDLSAQARKVRALWLFMHTPLGLVRDSSEAALGAYVKRVAGVDALQWTDYEQIKTVTESLKKWAMRALPDHVTAQREAVRAAIKAAGREATLDEARLLAQGAGSSYNTAHAVYEALSEALAGLKEGEL